MTPSRVLFRDTLATIAEQAKQTLPECSTRVDSAVKLVLNHDVELLADGTAKVATRSNPTKYYMANGVCDCKDFSNAPSHWCAHRIARGLQLRVERAMQAQEDAGGENTIPDEPNPEPVDDVPTELSDTLRRGLVFIKGKPFIRFSALLAEAHARGLTKLETTFISVTADLALAQCTATFGKSGLIVTDVADSTPGNVGKQVAAHWPRLAATRAAARALRNALNVGVCSLDEIEH